MDMSFHFQNAQFVADLGPLTQRVARSAFSGVAPAALYHYTSPHSGKKIVETKEIWATCVNAQEDLTELMHGIDLTERLAMELMDREPNLFVRKVLAKLPEFMRTRREMVFVTCFCGVAASEFHAKKYGSVCFKFDIPRGWKPALECTDLRADSWYSPVIYGEPEQVNALKAFLTDVSRLLAAHSSGHPEEDRVGWLQNGPIRDIGQCLLTIISCFKREIYSLDQEWRLVFTPNLALSYSAPQMLDDTFNTCVVNDPKRHICLRRKFVFNLRDGGIWPPPEHERGFPFDSIVRGASFFAA
jgi:hypothetical protein